MTKPHFLGFEKEERMFFHYGRKEFITKIEDIFIELLPECKILNTEEKPILDINHRFGAPHPMHFEDIYYNYRMQLLDDLILMAEKIDEI